jgi:hypothetical protein
MNFELMNRWIRALRSDQYIRVESQLRAIRRDESDGKKLCCALGVLADVLVQDGKYEWWESLSRGTVLLHAYKGQLDYGETVHVLMEELGVDRKLLSDVVTWNDGLGLPLRWTAERLRHRLYRARRKADRLRTQQLNEASQ